MGKRVIILVMLLCFCGHTSLAQTLDNFFGDSAVSCPASLSPGSPGYSVTATCSQSGTAVTCTLPSGQGVNFSPIEPIELSGSGTALDTIFNDITAMAGEDEITSTGISGDTITLTSPATATVAATAVTFKDGHFYIPLDAGGNVVTVNVPGWGARKALCTPQGHFFFMQTVSNICSSLVNGVCAPSTTNAVGSVTRLSNLATLNIGTASHFWNTGQPIQVKNCANAAYDVNPGQIASLSTNGLTFTYANVGPDDSTGTTGCQILGYGWNPAKYATFAGTQPDARCNSELGEMTRYAAMGFFGTGEDGDTYLNPTRNTPCQVGPSNGNTRWYPIFTNGTTPAASRYPGVNLWGCTSQPIKVPMYTVQPSLTGYLSSLIMYDWADPKWIAWHDCNWNPLTGLNVFNFAETPWAIGLVFDDSDNMQQTRASGVWRTVGAGVPSPDPGLLTLYSAPQITISNKAIYTNGIWTNPELYADSKDYYKDLAATPPASCTDAAPCSLADFLRVKYGTIAGLNAAWGTAYTTFGSSQSVFNGESVATPASYTFAHSNITPRSVQVVITPSGGSPVVVSGDCTLNIRDCPTGTAGAASFLAPPNCFTSGANFYNTAGVICVDANGDIEEVTAVGGSGAGKGETATTTPPWPANTSCSGTQTTVSLNVTFTCEGPKITGTLTYSTHSAVFAIGGSGSLPTGETLTVNYTTGGWDAGGTGLQDEDGLGGRGGITITNAVNLVCPQTYATGIVTTAYQTEVAFTSGSNTYWALAITSGTTSDPAPAFSITDGAVVTGSDGIQWTMLGVPTSQPGNTAANFHSSSDACPTFNTTNATIAADLESWDEQFFDFYFLGLHKIAAEYHVLNFGVNFGLGTYNSPTWLGGLKAASMYTDAAFVGDQNFLTTHVGLAPLSKLSLDYETKYFLRPIVTEPFMGSCAGDWQGYIKTCTGSDVQYNGLVARAQGWYAIINNELTYTAPDGSRPWAGISWWTDHVNDNSGGTGETSFALLDYMDNRLNGVENVTSSVSCSSPLSSLVCGGEVAGVGWLNVDEENCFHCIDAGLALAYSGGAPTLPTAKPRGLIWSEARKEILEKSANGKGKDFANRKTADRR